jgi:2-polyprenyl-3-methyl-5-hydroxy-6-metoxy-1,4-benzoquinol methylase
MRAAVYNGRSLKLSQRAPRLYRALAALRGWWLQEGGDYRAFLFQELRERLAGRRPERILEIGPKDGLDSRRLLGLQPERLTLVDLPRRESENAAWLKDLGEQVEYLSANLMYSEAVLKLPPFDVVWCTGVLYHNPEQLRMVRRLYDLLVPGGLLVLETATTRNERLRDENVVEILYPPPSEETRRRQHLSANVTHVPSARAVRSWLEMVGFRDVAASACHPKVSKAKDRVAYVARKPLDPSDGAYYTLGGEPGFVIGRSL